MEIVGTTKRKSFQSFVTFYLRAHRGAVKKSPKLLRVRFPNINPAQQDPMSCSVAGSSREEETRQRQCPPCPTSERWSAPCSPI